MVTITLSAAGAKKAASRLREFLAADGIRLKQTHAYEALAQTLGYANWNTLQALLNAKASPESAAGPAAPALADKQIVRTDKELAMELVPRYLRRRGAEGQKGTTLSGNLTQSLDRALALAFARHHEYATLEHLLHALTEDQDAVTVLRACKVDLTQLGAELTEFIDGKLGYLVTTASGDPRLAAGVQQVLQRAAIHVHASGREEMNGANVLVALFSQRESPSVDFLKRQGMTKVDAAEFTPGSEDSLTITDNFGRLRKRVEEARRKRRPPQTPTAGVPVEPRPKPKPPLKSAAKLKE